MLAHATGNNGDNNSTPRRYVACAMTTAGQDNSFGQLIALANTWVQYHFWPFKANKGSLRELHSASEIVTSTLQDTESLDFEGSCPRLYSFADAVKDRDGYRYIITRAVYLSRKPSQLPTTITEGAHIFKRAVAAGKHKIFGRICYLGHIAPLRCSL